MEVFKALVQQYILFGAGLALLLGVTSIVRNGKHGLVFSGLGVCVSIACLALFVYSRPDLQNRSWAMLLFATSLFLVGPLDLRLGYSLMDTSGRYFSLHLLPAAGGFALDIYLLSLPGDTRAAMIQNSLSTFSFDLINMAFLLGTLSIASYSLYLLYLLKKMRTDFELGRTTAIWILLLIPLVGFPLLTMGFLGKNDLIFHIGAIFIPLTLSMVFVYSTIYPNLLENLKSDIQLKRYETTVMSGIDVDAVSAQMEQLFTQQRIYRDENLKLQRLAEQLEINRHQLSRILNERYKKNFNEFVNGHRIEEAKQLIASSDDKIQGIAYRVGFNTRATFNAQFQTIAGMTPLEFRERGRSKG